MEVDSGAGYRNASFRYPLTQLSKSRSINRKYSTICYGSGFNNNNNNNNNNRKFNVASKMITMKSKPNNDIGNITKKLYKHKKLVSSIPATDLMQYKSRDLIAIKPPVTAERALDMCKLTRNYKQSDRTTLNTSSRNISKINQERRLSTGTLNRLILVAQALESEVQYRRQINVNGKRIVIALRTINLLLLFTIDGLILSGVGQYYSNLGGERSLILTPDKWYYNIYSKLPVTFGEMRLNGQYFATAITTIILIITIISHTIQLYWCKYSRLL
uniref:Transmembrane protein n=1 Tax=Elaeophora elaphi TaxID=1147741 RepID=A0A0R3RIZ2_9BILA